MSWIVAEPSNLCARNAIQRIQWADNFCPLWAGFNDRCINQLAESIQDVASMAIAAAVMTAKVAQPKYFSSGGVTWFPITCCLLVSRITRRIRGGASRPLITADQNNIPTALKPK